MLFLTLRRDELETLLENSETRAVGKDGTENNIKQIFVVLFLFFFFSRKRIVIRVVKKKKKQDIDFVAFCTTLNFSILLIGASEKEK